MLLLGSCIRVCVLLQLAPLFPCRSYRRAVLSDANFCVEVLDENPPVSGGSENRGCWLPVPGVGHVLATCVSSLAQSYLILPASWDSFLSSHVTKGRGGEAGTVGDARVSPTPLWMGGSMSSPPGGVLL